MSKRKNLLKSVSAGIATNKGVQATKGSGPSRKKTSDKLLTTKIFSGGDLATNLDFSELPNPDKILRNSGKSASDLFQNMMEDDHIYSVSEILISGILRHQWKLSSDNEKHKNILQAAFDKNGNIRNMIKGITLGRLRGMAIFEVVWEITKDGYVPTGIEQLPATDFTIDKNCVITHVPSGTKFDGDEYKYKFIVYRNNPAENPYGVAELLKCYYPWQFKKGAWRFWMTTTEKYGVPTMVVEVDVEEVDEDKINEKMDIVASAFYNADSDTVIVTNGLKDQGVHVLDTKGKAADFEKLIDKAEAAISKVIIGTHVLMDGSNGGSRALAEVAANINFRFKVQETILDICNCVNTIIEWFNILQFGISENKYNTKFLIPYINIQEWEKIREAIDRKVPVSKKAIYQHVPEPENDDDIFIGPDAAISKDKDIKTPTKETKSDTDDTRKRKTDKKQDEPRVDTSVPGKQNTGQNQ